MVKNISIHLSTARIGCILLLFLSGIGISIFSTTIFAQTPSPNTANVNTTTSSPLDSFNRPEGYSIAKKHVYDAPLLDIHFYCSSNSGGIMATCLLFDGNSTNASLIGIEYIISSEQYASLPEREKPNWIPLTEEEGAEARYPNLTPQQLTELYELFGDAYAKLIISWNPNDKLPQYPPQVIIESLIEGGEGRDNHDENAEAVSTPLNRTEG